MHSLQLRKALTVLGLAAIAVPVSTYAQVREVVSKEVTVGSSEASLVLEFADDGRLEITFEDGSVVVDGDVVGAFQPGDDLEVAWRSLLGQAIALDDGPLAQALSDWTVPAELAAELADVAQEIDQALQDALTEIEVDVDATGPSISLSIGSGEEGSLVNLLLGSVGRLGLLEDALEGLGPDLQVRIQEDVEVSAGEVIEGTLVVIQGAVTIEGEVHGDVVVVGGTIELLEGSLVTGEVRIADSRIVRNQGTVEQGVVDVLEDERDLEAELRDELREELRDEFRSDLRSELRNVTRIGRDDEGFSLMTPFRPVIRGVGGVLEKLIVVLVMGLIGAALVAFAGDNVDAIAETARRSPGRSAMVGFAGTFLLVPVYVLGVVALAVSIIGIPVAIAWVPLFPMAAGAAALIGYLAVARNAGEWLADSNYPWTGWIRKTNPVYTIFGGLLGLMLAFMAAHVISIAPFLHFLSGLLMFVGFLLTFFALQIGFGAVLLTRAGRRREYWSKYDDPDAAWEAAMSVDVEVETEGTSDTGGGDDEDA
jgi:hypothetical protein